MAVLLLPVAPSVPHQSVQVELEGVVFAMTLRWSQREEYWYLSLADVSGAAIVSGLKVVVNTPLLRRIASHDAPAGEIMALDVTGKLGDPDIDALGDEIPLVYIESE